MQSRLQSCSEVSIISRVRDDGSSARLGPAPLSTARPGRLQLHPPLLQAPQHRGSSGGRDGFKAGEQQLSSGSGPSAAALPPFRWKSDSVQTRFSVGGLLLLLIFLFHGRRAEAAGRKKEGKKTRGACWEM